MYFYYSPICPLTLNALLLHVAHTDANKSVVFFYEIEKMNTSTFFLKCKKLLSRYGFGPGRQMSLEKANSVGLSINKLHLGCGNIHINGWCNIDVIKTGATDVILDIKHLPGIRDNSIDNIYSCHVLEHFPTSEIEGILNRWYRVLAPGGEIRISVPDLDKITKIYQNNIAHFQISGNQPWIALIYGGQKDEYDFHKTGFNFCWLSKLLKDAGFGGIEEYSNSPHFIDGVVDNSMANQPFGEYISLNLKAYKL